MFFDRLVPGFIVQGGDWSTPDRTNSAPPVSVLDNGIYDLYVLNQQVNNPPLPQQVDSEFNYGPFISNTYGTLAMALQAGNPNSAANAFFINLADNSFPLDLESFTVFGRVLNAPSLSIGGTSLINAGTNLLNYFNNTNYFSPPASGIYTNNPQIPTLPVNYDGTNAPCNTNLFYVDFTFLTNLPPGVAGPAQPPVDTNLPTASITYPTSGLFLTNGSSFVVQGTASDDVGLARVYCFLVPQNGAHQGVPFGNNANGTTNWSLDFVQEFGGVPPGEYLAEAVSQDGAGNLSSPVGVPVTVTAVVINGNGIVAVANAADGSSTTNAIGAALQNGVEYITRAIPAAGQAFINWTGLGTVLISPSINFVMFSNLLVTANFIPNDIPGALAITYPANRGQLTNNNFSFTGTFSGVTPAQITCRLFSQATRVAVGQPVTVSGTASWSAPVTNLDSLQPGQYILQAVAYDAQGRSTVVTNAFTVMARLNLVTNGVGTIALSPSPNPAYPYVVPGSYTLTAKPGKGLLFYNWSDGVNVSINPVESLAISTTNLTLTATFVSNDLPTGLAFTYPAANAKLELPTFVATGKAPALTTNVIYQVFSQSSKLAVGPAVSVSPTASGSAQTWSLGVTNLAPGNYTATAVATDSKGRSALISENFDLLARLQIQYQGLGTVSPNLNGQYLVVGQPYSLKAIAGAGQLFKNWSGGISSQANPLTFTVTSNLALTVNFTTNYFPYVQGTYYGLYYPDSSPVETNSGYVTMNVNSSGTFSGTLTYSGRSITLGGAFQPDGTQELIGTVGNLAFYMALSLDLTNGTGTLTGALTNASSSYINWTANMVAYRGVTSLSSVTNFANARTTRDFVLTISGDPTEANLPGGNGYAALSIAPTGMISLVGILADNTSISQSVGLSKQGIWPLYISLYGNQGAIFGWETNNSPANFSGPLTWIKPAVSGTHGAYYPNGFNTNFSSSADSYSPPSPGSQYEITFGGGTVVGSLTNNLTVSAARQFIPAPNSTDKLTITLAATTGVLSGHFFNPATGKTLSFKGAFASPSVGGSGYTLDSDGQTGYLQIQPLP
jgi:cyclophilin family peptidyl-prolyl cis-trans isomerase